MNVQSAISVSSAPPPGPSAPGPEDAAAISGFAALIAGAPESTAKSKPSDAAPRSTSGKSKPEPGTDPATEKTDAQAVAAVDATALINALAMLAAPKSEAKADDYGTVPLEADAPADTSPAAALPALFTVLPQPEPPPAPAPTDSGKIAALASALSEKTASSELRASAPIVDQTNSDVELPQPDVLKQLLAASTQVADEPTAPRTELPQAAPDSIKVSNLSGDSNPRPLLSAAAAFAAQDNGGAAGQNAESGSDKAAAQSNNASTKPEAESRGNSFEENLLKTGTEPLTPTPQPHVTAAAHAANAQPTSDAGTSAIGAVRAPSEQVAVHVARAAADGDSNIRIQLQPGDLGTVDVRLHLGADGRVTAAIAADRQETLDLLQRDAAGLERALQDAGLRPTDTSLSFSLRGDGRSGFGAGERPQPFQLYAGGNAATDEKPSAQLANAYRPRSRGEIDITV